MIRDSDNSDFLALESLIQRLGFRFQKNLVKFAHSRMIGIYVPGMDAMDVAQETWRKFSCYLAKDGYEKSMLQHGETSEQQATRLCLLLFKIARDLIVDAKRKSQQPFVRAHVSSDIDPTEGACSLAAELRTSPGLEPIEIGELRQELEKLRVWVATQDTHLWRLVNVIIGIFADDRADVPTTEELAAEASHRLGEHVSCNQVRYARKLLQDKARSIPDLQIFLRYKI